MGMFTDLSSTSSHAVVELHPYLNQAEYTGWLKTQGIAVSGYSPFVSNIDFVPPVSHRIQGNLNPSYKSEGDIRIIDQVSRALLC